MGQEIGVQDVLDEAAFSDRLRHETQTVMSWFNDRAFAKPTPPMIGLELEAWLMNADGLPSPGNMDFLAALDDPDTVPELARFNFEYNAPPARLEGRVLSSMRNQLNTYWKKASDQARELDMQAMMIGIPPTLREYMLTTEYMTPSNRYNLLNARVFELREGVPQKVDIGGRDQLELLQDHLMLEAACTSLQIHLMVDQDEAARSFNAAQIASAPLLAVSANSHFLYGRRLWFETRIPAFESAIDLPTYRDAEGRRVGRVTFGAQHVRQSLMELFLENLNAYPPLLPMINSDNEDGLAHFKLQNGTVWRWNRPIVGVDGQGEPHLRIENRVLPAGPTVTDMMANIAFFLGLTLALKEEDGLEDKIPFEHARANFYAAARRGLNARVCWLDGEEVDIQPLILDRLVPMAAEGLKQAGLSALDVDQFLGIIRARALNGQTGAAWQRAHANCHGRDFQKLVLDYIHHQQSGMPVHTWTV